MVYQDDNKEYASKGVGTAGLTTGIIGTVLGSGLLNGGLAGILGGNQNPSASPVYQLSQKDNEIALLKAQQYRITRLSPSQRRWQALTPE